jgi:thiamine-phosphate pyrophosphorylase
VGQGILGRSCHSADDVRRAAAAGVDYATLSPFAPTASKPGHGPPVREQEFVGLPIPTLALGGVTVGNAALARAAGAHGVAVMGEVMRSDHPGRTVAQLLAVVG